MKTDKEKLSTKKRQRADAKRKCRPSHAGHIEHTTPGFRDRRRFSARRNLHNRWRLQKNEEKPTEKASPAARKRWILTRCFKPKERWKRNIKTGPEEISREHGHTRSTMWPPTPSTLSLKPTLAVSPHDQNYHHDGGHIANETDGQNNFLEC